jgi:hypothetical protein
VLSVVFYFPMGGLVFLHGFAAALLLPLWFLMLFTPFWFCNKVCLLLSWLFSFMESPRGSFYSVILLPIISTSYQYIKLFINGWLNLLLFCNFLSCVIRSWTRIPFSFILVGFYVYWGFCGRIRREGSGIGKDTEEWRGWKYGAYIHIGK